MANPAPTTASVPAANLSAEPQAPPVEPQASPAGPQALAPAVPVNQPIEADPALTDDDSALGDEV
ncbi:hypothetical protein MMC31_007396 [Peltigera leucophlebia]|nr:hypothetical protein [Peltigera leucophlebia]